MFNLHAGGRMYIVKRSMAALSGDWFMAIELICFVCKKILIFRHISRLFSVQNAVLEVC